MSKPPLADIRAIDDRLAMMSSAGMLDDVRAVRRAALSVVSTLSLNRHEQGWLAQGVAYAAGHIDDAALELVRTDAWDSLDGRDCDFADPRVNRVRAILCVLYPDEDLQDPLIYLETVLEFHADAKGDASLALRALDALALAPRGERGEGR